MAAWSSWANHR